MLGPNGKLFMHWWPTAVQKIAAAHGRGPHSRMVDAAHERGPNSLPPKQGKAIGTRDVEGSQHVFVRALGTLHAELLSEEIKRLLPLR